MKTQQSSTTNFIDVEFRLEKPAMNNITALYSRHEDEPDFDCEFLYVESLDSRKNESILDPDLEDNLADDYQDNEWDTDIYDPYLEQTYY